MKKKKKASFNNKAESKQPKIGRTEDAGRVKSEYTEEKSKLNWKQTEKKGAGNTGRKKKGTN